MPEDLSREEEQRGTGKLITWGVVIAAVFFIGLLAIFVLKPLMTGS
ncbi:MULTISPECIES: hypothetical protein [unclassified Mesorhizobium]|nr:MULTISPECIES: hypothetical protein [unclassified Mesorhizobium]MBZ9702754.1 hypothetical protein [Mesorhizobium sp. CO1-1-3]MBZ9897442.1 hypothetical protein [Mesorhizobium sp. BR1-1-6]MBZ9948527.1 hypothetical protein [Mesorhizobium sp. BR1-1-11]MBZ9961479.1 hypothetical protein [Mesorhizobium sp. BR1-1-14]MBZ9984590.1 hypothetical protein [Mesorhizobium sp. BR-1-1-8]